MTILLLTSDVEVPSSKRIIEEAKKRGHSVVTMIPRDIILHTSESVNGYDSVAVRDKRIFKKDIDVIISRMGSGTKYGCKVLRHFVENLGIPSTCTAEAIEMASDKWRSIQKCSASKIRVPKSTIAKDPSSVDFDGLVNSVGGLPCVAKTLTGSQGKGVMILETPLAASTALSTLAKNDVEMMFQRFIESSKQDEKKADIRAWVIDGEFITAYKRFSIKGGFRSNYSLSKDGEKVTLTNEEKLMAINAAKALGLGITGVDIVRDANDNNKPYFIEANSNPSLVGVEKITEENVAVKIVMYAEKLAKQKKGNGKLSKLSELDSSKVGLCSATRAAMNSGWYSGKSVEDIINNSPMTKYGNGTGPRPW